MYLMSLPDNLPQGFACLDSCNQAAEGMSLRMPTKCACLLGL
jgi:hypothetical protein